MGLFIFIPRCHRRKISNSSRSEESAVHFSRPGERERTRSFPNPGFEAYDEETYETVNNIQQRALPYIPLDKLPGQYPVVDGIPQIQSSDCGAAAKQYDSPVLIEDEERPMVVEIPQDKRTPARSKKKQRYVDSPNYSTKHPQRSSRLGHTLTPDTVEGNDSKYEALQKRPMADDAAGSTYARLDARTMETRTLQELYVPVINSEEKQKDDIRVYDEFIPQLENSDNEDDEEPGDINLSSELAISTAVLSYTNDSEQRKKSETATKQSIDRQGDSYL